MKANKQAHSTCLQTLDPACSTRFIISRIPNVIVHTFPLHHMYSKRNGSLHNLKAHPVTNGFPHFSSPGPPQTLQNMLK
jgi:hypothetical protein